MIKILIIRFSSIGDIVLTTPVIRCLYEQVEGSEIHFLTKKQFEPVLSENPFIHKIHTIEYKFEDVILNLKQEKFDHIIDLHKNFRSKRVIMALKRPYKSFHKLNVKKWIRVRLRIDLLPNIHIVDRYLGTVRHLGIKNDGKGLDYFVPHKDNVNVTSLPETFRKGFIGFVIGGKHNTKIFPEEKVIDVCQKLNKPVVLLGGREDREKGERIKMAMGENIYNACGIYTINQSASLVQQADGIITNDTGLMHIAAAFKKPITSLWGNTIPEFGMYPYFPALAVEPSAIIQIPDLRCRPCSKLGYKKCPKGHFDCMKKIDNQLVADSVNENS